MPESRERLFRELRATMEARRTELEYLINSTHDGVQVSGDAYDPSVNELQHNAAVLLERRKYELGRIYKALARMRTRCYGVCQEQGCGEMIDSHRLRALPEAFACIDCATRKEQKTARNIA